MKTNLFKRIILISMGLIIQIQGNSQVSTGVNNGIASDYVGWDQFQTWPLEIRHDGIDYPINFHTNLPSVANPNFNMRMKIWRDNVKLPDGTTDYEVGRVGILNSWEGWSAYPRPVSLLHLGSGINGNGNSGYRKWMDIGSFTNGGNDCMYFGLKHEPRGPVLARNFSQYMDAVIGWGDNEDIPDSFNDLRFIFTAKTTTVGDPLGVSTDGRETMRISYNGNVGIGNFYIPGTPSPGFTPSSAIRPARKLEILDEGRNQPQFRLTFTQVGNTNPAYTDFQATSTGDLVINPIFNGGNRYVGINTTNPITNTLQLFANGTDQSGLRFERLTSTSPTVASNGRVLTVDGFGNVVLTNDNGGGGGSPNTANNGLTLTGSNIQLGGPLVQNTQVALDNYTFKYIGPSFAGQTLRWQIENDGRQKSWCSELSSGTAWDYFVPFRQSTLTQTGLNLFSTANTSATNYGINNQITNSDQSNTEIVAYNATLLNMNVNPNTQKRYIAYSSAQREYAKDNQAFYGKITPTNRKNENKGLNLEISNAALSYGCDNVVYSSENAFGYKTKVYDIQNTGYGVYADVRASKNAYGVYGIAKDADVNYGVYGDASGGSFNAAGYFNGDLWSASPLMIISDSIFKINVNPYKNASTVLNQLNPKEYLFNKAKYPQINFPTRNQIGLIAQEVERIEPSLVSSMQHPAVYDSLGNLISSPVNYKGVNYTGIIPILIGGFKDHDTKISNLENTIRSQQTTLDQLQTQLKDVLQKLDECCSNRQRNSNIDNQDINLSNETSIVLDQNSPNPFRETTKIRYVIPADAKNARIIFYNNVGKMINEIKLTVFNEGFINVFGEDLSSGQYTYSLIIDGKLIDTKKMIKE